jgi:hypothetical protein
MIGVGRIALGDAMQMAGAAFALHDLSAGGAGYHCRRIGKSPSVRAFKRGIGCAIFIEKRGDG